MFAQYDADVAHGSTMVEAFLGGVPKSHAALYRVASPICHVHGGMPAVWMAHGTADGVVPVSQSRDMASALVTAGCDPVYLEARGLGHTACEIGPDGKPLEPNKLLFEDDVSRFIVRSLQ